MSRDAQCSSFTEQFEDVAADESLWQQRRREALRLRTDAPRVGLALSGGGIRSATFNAGLLDSLDRHGVLKDVDYLSTVSGGGYIGACASRLLNQPASDGVKQEPLFARRVVDQETSVMGWLRAHGQYLVSAPGFSGWTLAASILASTSLNLLVFLPVLLLVMALLSHDFLALSWPLQSVLPLAAGNAGHDGFSLLLMASCVGALSFGLMVLAYAAISGVPRLRTAARVLTLRRWMGLALKLSLALGALGLIPAVTLFDEWLLVSLAQGSGASWLRHATWLTPLSGGLLALWRARGHAQRQARGSAQGQARRVRRLAGAGLMLVVVGSLLFSYHLVAHTQLMSTPLYWGVLALAVVFGFCCDPNWVSMHSYYRARIACAFLPRTRDGSQERYHNALDFPLQGITPYSGAPLHLINCTLNTSNSAKALWRSRRGASFTLSPLFCGSDLTGYQRANDYMGGRLSLSAAVTISGAAVDPNNQLVQSRPISAFMALLNCRLGYWADHPRARFAPQLGADWLSLVGRELLGVGLSESSRKIHLSDGGQFDNLGVYELVRRRCEYIVVSDAGADPDCTLSDLGRVVDRVRADFGADIKMETAPLLKHARGGDGFCPMAIGVIRYADGTAGTLLYLKASLFSELPVNVYAYAAQHQDFPHQSTADQFFDEDQFSAYASLGRALADRLAGDAPASMVTLFERAADVVRAASGDTETSVERRRPGSPMRQPAEAEADQVVRSLGAR